MQRRIDASYYDEMTQRCPLALAYFDEWFWKKQRQIDSGYFPDDDGHKPETKWGFWELPFELQNMYYDIFLQEHDDVHVPDIWGAWTSYMVYHLQPKLEDE